MRKTKNGEPCGLITNIQKYTIHDGPGIRTEIFFKGCTLSCKWCSNPEGISPAQELGIYPKKCVGRDKCGYCVSACPAGADTPLKFSDGVILPIPTVGACKDCLKCAEACPADSIIIWGQEMTVPELMKLILADRSFYQRSGGGVTLNGGEVLVQWEFASLLLQECRKSHINTCVESALNCPAEHVREVMQYADYVIADIKHIDSEVHRSFAGVGNERILENMKMVADMGKRLVIRTPVVAGYNNQEENIRGIASFIKNELKGQIVQYQLLPYRKMGTEKYDTLAQAYPMGDYVPPERESWEADLKKLTAIAAGEFGLPAVAGSGHDWK